MALSITITSVTQVYTIYLSFIAYTSQLNDVYAGSYIYDSFLPTSYLSTEIEGYTPSAHAIDFYGFNGFIIDNDGFAFSYSSTL